MNHLHNRFFRGDEDYLHEIKAGGPKARDAIGNLYKKYRKRIYVAMKRLISKHPLYRGSPQDLVHESFIILMEKIQLESFHTKSVCGFWFGIGRNLFLNQLKKDERTILVNEQEAYYGLDEDSPEVLFLRKEEEEQKLATFSQLGPRCQEILMLWINRFTMTEIAEQMHLSTDAMARKIKFSCFKKLKELACKGNKMPH